MSTEKRMILAFALSALIFVIWAKLFPPPQLEQDLIQQQEQAESIELGEIDDSGTSGAEDDVSDGVSDGVTAATAEEQEEQLVEQIAEVKQAELEETVTLSNDVMTVKMSNRGATITSIKLHYYESDDPELGELDIVQNFESEQRATPLQLIDRDGTDQRMYVVERFENKALFSWSDGKGNTVEKEIGIHEASYGISVRVDVSGELEESRLAIGTGMRDTGPVERENRLSQWGNAVIVNTEDLEQIKRKKVKELKIIQASGLLFAGFEDTYFINVLRFDSRIEDVEIEPVTYTSVIEKKGKENEEAEKEVEEIQVLRVSVGIDRGRFEGELLAAPKEYELMNQIGGGLERTVSFGFFHPISVFFLKALWWIYERVANYGLAIILLTLAIRIVLFPLMHKSTVSMRRMAKLQPKIKAIQGKYKKQKSDPQARQKMSQETMELYKTEGVNPVGGCLPMLVQLPILWALYQLFLKAIELRHAPFMFWIQDLSAKDPWYVTPILMAVTMWLQQKLAPQTGDPQQQRIFRMMPFIFGFMFLQFPAGLVLYWLTNNVITIMQQEITLRMIGEKGKGKK